MGVRDVESEAIESRFGRRRRVGRHGGGGEASVGLQEWEAVVGQILQRRGRGGECEVS